MNPQNIIAVFRSRGQAAEYGARLERCGIKSSTISTPQRISRGCGVSVSISRDDFALAREKCGTAGMTAFDGWYGYNEKKRRYEVIR